MTKPRYVETSCAAGLQVRGLASSVDASDPRSYAWNVNFNNGNCNINNQNNKARVRAVRSAPLSSEYPGACEITFRELFDAWQRARVKKIPSCECLRAKQAVAGEVRGCYSMISAATAKRAENCSRLSKERWANPEFRLRMSALQKSAWANPIIRTQRIKGLKRAFANPEIKQRMIEGQKRHWQNEQVRASASERQRRAWADPVAREHRIEGLKRAFAKSEVKARFKAAKDDPKYRARISKSIKRAWKDGRLCSSENRSRAIAKNWSDPGIRARIIASLKRTYAAGSWKQNVYK